MVGKAPIYTLSRSKALKTQQICHYRYAKKTSGLFLLYDTGVDFSSRNNFANLDTFAKVSVSVESIIPWIYRLRIWVWVKESWEEIYHSSKHHKYSCADKVENLLLKTLFSTWITFTNVGSKKKRTDNLHCNWSLSANFRRYFSQ